MYFINGSSCVQLQAGYLNFVNELSGTLLYGLYLFIMKSKIVLVHDTMAYVYYMEICQLHAMPPLSPGKWSPVHNRFTAG